MNFICVLYFIFLGAMFFVEVPNALLLSLGFFVYAFLSYDFLRKKNIGIRNRYTGRSLLLSGLLAGGILIALGVLQSLTIGYDPTDAVHETIFKLYGLLSVFVINAFIAKRKIKRGKQV